MIGGDKKSVDTKCAFFCGREEESEEIGELYR
jgi:hypothetical protein